MSFLEKIKQTCAKPASEEESSVSPHDGRYDQHAPIDFGEWGQAEEPPLGLEMVAEDEPQMRSADGGREAANSKCSEPGAVLPIVLTVMAAEGDYFEGSDLLREFNAAGLHIGKDGLFHAFPEHGVRAPLFSISNVLNPGLFDAQKIMTLQTRGVALFAQLPAAHSGKACFSALVETANRLATGLGGQIMDSERRLLTNHTLQRMQEQVLEFEYCRELERRKAGQSGS